MNAFVFDKDQTQNLYTDIFKVNNKIYLKVFSDNDFENRLKVFFKSFRSEEY